MKTKNLIILDQILAITSIAALLLSHLALTDIAHGEPDLSGEWLILRVTAGLLLIFITFTLFTTKRILKDWHEQNSISNTQEEK
jgi:hypothetical protein